MGQISIDLLKKNFDLKVTTYKQIFYLNFEFAQSQGSRLLGTKQFLMLVIAKFFKILQAKKKNVEVHCVLVLYIEKNSIPNILKVHIQQENLKQKKNFFFAKMKFKNVMDVWTNFFRQLAFFRDVRLGISINRYWKGTYFGHIWHLKLDFRIR